MALSSLVLVFFVPIALPAPPPTTLTVAAAADLSPLESALAAQSPVPLRFVTEASAVIAQQIQNGAPYDIFLSANAAYVERLISFGKIKRQDVRVYAIGRLGLLCRSCKYHAIQDLQENWVRIVALPNPRLAPYGVAAQQALEHAGIWAKVQPKVVYGENVRETLELFTSGNADAVLTSASLLRGRNPDLIPTGWHQPILQKGGIISATQHPAEARRFLEFVTSPAGQAIFAEFGFEPKSGH